MKNIIFIFITFILIGNFNKSYACLPNGITFSSQQQIDDFATDYPNCTEIEGDVYIEELTFGNITNLNGLSQLTSMGGNLRIINNSGLINLVGLDNIASVEGGIYLTNNNSISNLTGFNNINIVEGYVYIGYNEALVNLTGFNNLNSVNDYFRVINNPQLSNLTGLNNLASVGGYLNFEYNESLQSLSEIGQLTSVGSSITVSNNDILTDLSGLDNINSLPGSLAVSFNSSLSNLTGLDNLESIGGNFHIESNQELNDLSELSSLTSIGNIVIIDNNDGLIDLFGLDNLTSIGKYLDIKNNSSLIDLNGLENLTSINGALTIKNNEELLSLIGIQNIDPNSIESQDNSYEDLVIFNNSSLPECDVQSICDFFDLPNKTKDIHDNMIGCNSVQEIENACDNIYIPNCTNLNIPVNEAINVDISINLTWNESTEATGYKLSIGTNTNSGDIMDNEDVGNVTTYDPGDFPCESEIFVTIIPYNNNGDAMGCEEESFTTEDVTAVASDDAVICIGENTQLNASGGTTYNWEPNTSLNDPNIANPIATPSENTTYFVTVSNEGRCPDVDEVTIFVNEVIAGTIGSDQTICSGEEAEELIEFNEGSGDGTLTYQWQYSSVDCDQSFTDITGATSSDYNPGILQSTTFYHRIDIYTSNNGLICSDTSNCIVITVNQNPIPNAVATDESYNNANDGTATCNPSIGTSPYIYLWSNDETSQSIYNLTPGNYTITVTDIYNCEGEETVIVEEYICLNLEIIGTQENNSCYQECDGTIIIYEIINGIPPFLYSWSNGETESAADSLCSGIYYVTIIDSKNCSITDSFEIIQPDQLEANASATDETENNANDGTATCTPTGGNLPYSYAWSISETTQSIDNLAPGSYTVTVTDNNGCISIESVSVAEFGCQNLAIEINQNNISCYGECYGVLEISGITNGVSPFTYTWSNAENTASIDSLCLGSYDVTVVDGNNCNIYGTYEMTEPEVLLANTVYTNETSYNANDGTATSNPTGGTSPYSFIWSNGKTTQTISGLVPNQYIVTVTDSNSCFSIDTVNIETYICPYLSVNSQVDNASCFGICDGSIAISSVDNSVSPLFYSWNTGANSDSLSNLCAGEYIVTITDANNCSISDTILISQPDEIIITIDSTYGVNITQSGYIGISINNIGNYTFDWSGPGNFRSKTKNLDSLSDFGCYTLTITDTITNCTADSTICIKDLTSVLDFEYISSKINLYPNPTSENFTLDFNEINLKEVKIYLLDLTGKVQIIIIKKAKDKQVEFNSENIDAGLYIIQIKSEKFGTLYKKVIISK